MLRGVMADAECPRCHMRSPPPASRLATCPRCALVFEPHELVARPPQPPEEELPEPPPQVTVQREGRALTVSWPILFVAHHVIEISDAVVEHHIAFTIGTRTRIELDRVRRLELRRPYWFHELHLHSHRRRVRTLLVRSTELAPLAYAGGLLATQLGLPLER